MNIREAVLADFDEIKRLYAPLHVDVPVVSDGRDRPIFETILASDHLSLFVGEMDGRLVATCYMNYIPNMTRNVSPYCIVENVVTKESLRNLG